MDRCQLRSELHPESKAGGDRSEMDKAIVMYAPARFPVNEQKKTLAVFRRLCGFPFDNGTDSVTRPSDRSIAVNTKADIESIIAEKNKFFHVNARHPH
uniref:Uncharacterized protein n=1 Tax=Parascaris equorum TaxID=6256 RepID=A0A914S3Q8_PAREQ